MDPFEKAVGRGRLLFVNCPYLVLSAQYYDAPDRFVLPEYDAEQRKFLGGTFNLIAKPWYNLALHNED